MSGYLMYGYAHHHGWPTLRKFSTPVEIYVTTVSSFSRIIITFWYRSVCTTQVAPILYYTGIVAVS